eukprot:CAMPEP_0114122186 /NCGR_PEP_ID=MMETSP0043_2-20121206/7565_1 /TAXON_ID=464988 /ORGANISM="Hemiselmis andersenii, Strain CCMP644" /LENGTH=81 /DNA_ID=CAMNT_0001214893 /DNA_START=172 /DNA_END=417 /DNA_ORIENTATION=+
MKRASQLALRAAHTWSHDAPWSPATTWRSAGGLIDLLERGAGETQKRDVLMYAFPCTVLFDDVRQDARQNSKTLLPSTDAL